MEGDGIRHSHLVVVSATTMPAIPVVALWSSTVRNGIVTGFSSEDPPYMISGSLSFNGEGFVRQALADDGSAVSATVPGNLAFSIHNSVQQDFTQGLRFQPHQSRVYDCG